MLNIKSYDGINCMWICTNYLEILSDIDHINKKYCAKSFEIFDFSTLYTKFEHESLKENLKWCMERAFNKKLGGVAPLKSAHMVFRLVGYLQKVEKKVLEFFGIFWNLGLLFGLGLLLGLVLELLQLCFWVKLVSLTV